MSQSQTDPTLPVGGQPVMFDHEKLDVYQMGLRFIAWVTPLLDEAAAAAKGRTREVCDQLDRASLSVLLNTAEGNGKRQRQVRANFFDGVRGSATECAACLGALVAKNLTVETRVVGGKKMLCGLVDRFDSPAALRDEACEIQMDRLSAGKIVYRSGASMLRTRTTARKN